MSSTRASFTSLPREIRLAIFGELFNSTTLSFAATPLDFEGDGSSLRIITNVLAVLRASKGIHAEAKSLWLSRCLFHFETTERMLDVLTRLPKETLSGIRYVLITKALPVCVKLSEGQFMPHRFYKALSFLPGLQLDRLVVVDPWHDAATHEEDILNLLESEFPFDLTTIGMVGDLVQYGNGWKELYIYVPSLSPFFSDFEPVNEQHGDTVYKYTEAEEWTKILKRRNSKSGGVGFSLHIAHQMGENIPLWLGQRQGISGGEECWVRDDEQLIANLKIRWDSECDQPKPTCSARDNSVVVIIRRGQDAPYVQKGKLDVKLRHGMAGLNWSEAKREGLIIDPRGLLPSCY